MDFFVFPVKNSRIIPSEWLEELFPDFNLVDIFSKLEASLSNPGNCILGIYNKKSKKIEGFIWGEKHPILPTLSVLSFYICKNYRKNPKVGGIVLEYLKENGKSLGYKDVLFLTDKPNFFLKRSCSSYKSCVKLQIDNDV